MIYYTKTKVDKKHEGVKIHFGPRKLSMGGGGGGLGRGIGVVW